MIFYRTLMIYFYYLLGKKLFHIELIKSPSSQSAVWSSPVKIIIGIVIKSQIILTGITKQHAAIASTNFNAYHATKNGIAKMRRPPSLVLLYPTSFTPYLFFRFSSSEIENWYISPAIAPPINVTSNDSIILSFLRFSEYIWLLYLKSNQKF